MTTTKEILRGLPYFADLPDDLLEDVCAASEQLDVEDGTEIITEGTASEEMYVIVEGELTVTKDTAGVKSVVLAKLGPGEVVGEIAMLDGAPRTATVSTSMDSKLIRVPAQAFDRLLSDAGVVRRMFRTVTDRLRGIEDTVRHEERMAALGRMAAQLMHELNNPAAAVGRSTRELKDVYDDLADESQVLAKHLSGVELTDPEPPERMSPLERSDAEEGIALWLEERDVEDAWELAPGMVGAGWTPEALEQVFAPLDDELEPHMARWVALRATAAQLIGEISVAAGRVSELVRIVKEYSYLDQAPVQEIVPTGGIQDTLVLLKHKLKEIDVQTDFPDDLATVEAPGRDLNQVWTNLIDNAADAMEEGGTLSIAARNIGDDLVRVTVADTGTGMPEDVAARIFDPFFTTKEPGKGTGLGLHTVHTIVTRIGGDIRVESSPEGTTFTVDIPRTAVT